MKSWLARTRWYQKLVLILVLLFVLYLVLAPLLLAFWGRSKLVTEVAALTGKEVRLGGLYFNPLANSLTLKDFAIADPSGDIIRFARLSVDLELMPLFSHELYLRELTLVAPYVKLVRLADGKSVNLQTLIKPQPTSATAPNNDSQGGLPLLPVLANLDISQGQFELVDESTKTPASLLIDKINLRSHDVSLTPNYAAPYQLALAFAQGGELRVDGELTAQPLAVTANIKLTDLALTQANPWLGDFITGTLASGKLQTSLAVTLAKEAVQVSGQAELQQLQLDDANKQPLLAWDSLAATGLSVDTAAQGVTLDALTLTGVNGQFEVYADGKTSLDKLLLSQPVAANKPAVEQAPAKPWQVAIAQIKVDAKQLEFIDHSIKPSYQLQAAPLQLSLGPLDSSNQRVADLDLATKLGGYAPLTIKGSVAAFAKRPDTRLAIRLHGYDMTNLTPYTGRFIGYQVQKGQLGVSTDMSLKGSMLTSSSSIDANNFYLGNKVESKDAITAPVKFGLSILRDSKGNIDLPLKVSGDLADPSVSVHGLVLKALLNVLTKAATAPLSALSLLSGGVDLEKVVFAAGSAKLDEATLASLAKVLAQRPELKLGLIGSTSAEDVTALNAKGQTGAAQGQALLALADARAKAVKLLLINDFAISSKRLYLEQPQTGSKITGVLLSAINQ